MSTASTRSPSSWARREEGTNMGCINFVAMWRELGNHMKFPLILLVTSTNHIESCAMELRLATALPRRDCALQGPRGLFNIAGSVNLFFQYGLSFELAEGYSTATLNTGVRGEQTSYILLTSSMWCSRKVLKSKTFPDGSPEGFLNAEMSKKKWIFPAFFCALIFFFCDCLCVHSGLRSLRNLHFPQMAR